MILNSHLANLVAILTVSAIVTAANATVIYSESFDYGSSDATVGSVGNWNSSSGVLKYDADGGLDHPALTDEAGGAMWLDYDEARTATDSTPNFDLSTTYGFGAGDTVWMATLFEYVSNTNAHFVDVAGGSVSSMGVSISSAGDVSVKATINSSVNATNSTGITLGDGIYLMLLRYTKGSGTLPTDSAVDLWINPTDASSAAALGTADWTLDSGDGQIKWGRDGDVLSSIEAGPSQQGRIDEIRLATSLAEIGVVPEPASLALVGLGGLLMMGRTRD